MTSGSTEVVDLVEHPAPPSCSACADTGQVAPDAFGHWVPWSDYVATIAVRELAEGWPPTTSPIAVGMLHPMPCPECRAQESPPGQSVTEGANQTSALARTVISSNLLFKL
ncbi:hypothetical protein SAMN05444166_6270 [Singulisphaera sp. GP187]|uniref:hypothetical protein n=1 Tax=Singulisphaera sp. GP187 TaxID=1882752 RepID=UPI00092AC08A|nr:hypothetical protein [Singulisphaera sp. GP187]SIO60108.1 hypothetical protein SAMN05444166_6270 [Singulisphaera sp. GP187]